MSAPGTERTDKQGPDRLWVAAVLLIVAGIFVIDAAPRIAAPFGDSHDGRNGATWALGSRTLRELGWTESKGGALMGERGSIYAHHPPLVIFETALADTVGGERPWATKAPAYLSSVLAVFVLYALLRVLGLRRGASLAATVAVIGTPMFLVYGAVLNMEAISFPLGVGFLAVLVLLLSGRRCPGWLVFLVAVLTPLSSWQGVFLAGVGGAAAIWRIVRKDERATRFRLLLLGVSIGTGTAVAWLLYANGWSVQPLVDQTAFRVTGGSVGFREVLVRNWRWLRETFPLWVPLALGPVFIASLVDRRTRLVAVVSWTMVLVFAFGLGNGSFIHDYWNYWLLLPLAVGVAAGVDVLFGERRGPVLLALGLAAVALIVAVAGSSPAEQRIVHGAEAGRVMVAAQYPVDQRFAWTLGLLSRPLWIDYYARMPSRPLDRDSVPDSLKGTYADDLVFVTERQRERHVRAWATLVERGLVPVGYSYAVVRAEDLVDAVRSLDR